MSKTKIELLSRQSLADMLGMTKAGISHAVNHQKKLRDTKHDGKTGINLHDTLTIRYVAEVCSKKNIPLPPEFQEEKSEIEIFMEAVIYSLEKNFPDDFEDKQQDFKNDVVEYVQGNDN